jgi:hypothetical protein
MRDWFRVNVEQPLNRLSVNWDAIFLVPWVLYAIFIVLSGGGR